MRHWSKVNLVLNELKAKTVGYKIAQQSEIVKQQSRTNFATIVNSCSIATTICSIKLHHNKLLVSLSGMDCKTALPQGWHNGSSAFYFTSLLELGFIKRSDFLLSRR